jgi:hypothetical protein
VAEGAAGEADLAVPEYLHDDARIDASRDEQRRTAMTQIMEAQPLKPTVRL